jgi:hypothetical protein
MLEHLHNAILFNQSKINNEIMIETIDIVILKPVADEYLSTTEPVEGFIDFLKEEGIIISNNVKRK